MIRGSIHQEDITVVNIYEPNIATLKYMNQKQTQLKGKNKEYESNTLLSTIARSSRRKVNKQPAD